MGSLETIYDADENARGEASSPDLARDEKSDASSSVRLPKECLDQVRINGVKYLESPERLQNGSQVDSAALSKIDELHEISSGGLCTFRNISKANKSKIGSQEMRELDQKSYELPFLTASSLVTTP